MTGHGPFPGRSPASSQGHHSASGDLGSGGRRGEGRPLATGPWGPRTEESAGASTAKAAGRARFFLPRMA
jgi:hypothetical protein